MRYARRPRPEHRSCWVCDSKISRPLRGPNQRLATRVRICVKNGGRKVGNLALGGNGGLFTDDHWSEAESWGRWTAATQAALSFSVGAPRDLGFELLIRGLLSARAPKQSAWVEANGCRVGSVEFDLAHGGAETISGSIPTSCIDADGKVVLRINTDRVRTPKEIGINADIRPLGVGIERVAIRESITVES